MPYFGFLPGTDARVLSALLETTEPRSGRRIAARAGVGHTSANRVLSKWVVLGLAHGTDTGHAILYSLNRRHLAFGPLEDLAQLRRELVQRIGHDIKNWSFKPVFVSVFGSTARADGDTRSDIDILVVRSELDYRDEDAWEEQIETLRSDVLAWTGNHAGISVVKPSDRDAGIRGRKNVWTAVADEGLAVYGKPVGYWSER